MIMLNREPTNDRVDWQAAFLLLLPEITQLLQIVFHDRDSVAGEEAVQNGTVLCLVAFESLSRRGRAGAATASTLVWYAVLQIKSGRIAGSKLNSWEPLSSYAQRRRGIKVERLQSHDRSERSWIDALVADRRASVVDLVATRLDFRAWLGTLCKRYRRIAIDLAQGFATAEAASKYRVSRGRISQLRRELKCSWCEFQHEGDAVPARS